MIGKSRKLPANFFGEISSVEFKKPPLTERTMPIMEENETPHFNHHGNKHYQSLMSDDIGQAPIIVNQELHTIRRSKQKPTKTLIGYRHNSNLH
jgi:hypothetical protein